MGLDITAYENIRINRECDESEYYFPNSGFIQSNMPHIENKEINISCDDAHDFRAGSYMGYNAFRKALCMASNNIEVDSLWASNDESLKFYWLINFSDCEGYIGTSYCKILYDEFCKYENEVKPKLNDYFQSVYDDFKKAFKLGAKNGLVDFH